MSDDNFSILSVIRQAQARLLDRAGNLLSNVQERPLANQVWAVAERLRDEADEYATRKR